MSGASNKGPLQGIPIGLKDNLATAGIRTTLGTRVLADFVPDEDAEVAMRCRAAGAVILGKENMEEFAAGATSNNPHFGAVRNPWGPDHIPGGSSGGGGANVAAEVTFASLGTDLGGSVRLPGSFCGVVGLKQTFGRVSQRGLLVTSYNGDHHRSHDPLGGRQRHPSPGPRGPRPARPQQRACSGPRLFRRLAPGRPGPANGRANESLFRGPGNPTSRKPPGGPWRPWRSWVPSRSRWSFP